MTATQAPTPGPLDSESVKLLVKGDLLRRIDGRISIHGLEYESGLSGTYLDGTTHANSPWSHFTFIGRPDADGWMPWSGGENPVGDAVVEVKCRDGSTGIDTGSIWQWDSEYAPIIAFRLAPAAPVEASGSERDGPEVGEDAVAKILAPYLPTINSTPDLLSILYDADLMPEQTVTVRGAICVAAVCEAYKVALRPQPSGETREAVARIIDPSAFLFSPDELPKGSRAQFDAFDRADRILTLLSARSLALGGQHSTATDFPPDNVLACVNDTTPARAEAHDEAAAGEPVGMSEDERHRWLAGRHDWREGDWEDHCGKPWCEECKGEIPMTKPRRAHPSPTPAADDDRVRMYGALERIAAATPENTNNETAARMAGWTQAVANTALAALKSTAAKEGGAK